MPNETHIAPAISLRHGTDDDQALIRTTWLKSFEASPLASSLYRSTYMTRWSKIIGDLLARSEILVACDPQDDHMIIGYLVHEPMDRIVHFVYVKRALRSFGVCRAMLEEAGYGNGSYCYTHRTQDSMKITLEQKKQGKRVPLYDFTLIFQ
jgi:hypothetical protein